MSNNILLPTSEPDASGSRRRGGPSRLGVVAALTALIVAVAVWPSPAEEGPADPLPVPEPFSPPVGEWAESSFADLDGSFIDIAERNRRLVAIGTGLRVDSPPFVYWSDDAETWNVADGPWERGELILQVAAHDDGFLAAGHGLNLETLESNGLRLWVSATGDLWETIDPIGLGASPVVTGLAHAGDRFVAIGYEGEAGADPGFRSDGGTAGRVWESPDGVSWTDITPEGVEPSFESLAVADNGDVLVGGVARQQPTVWRLGDDWSVSSNPREEYRDQSANAIVADDDDLIVMSQASFPESMVWMWSVDGDGTWRGLFGETRRPQSTGWMTSIDGDLYAGSRFSRAVFTTGPEMWVSDRGRDWFGVEVTRGASPWPPAAVATAIEWNGELMAFGSRGGVPTVWTLAD